MILSLVAGGEEKVGPDDDGGAGDAEDGRGTDRRDQWERHASLESALKSDWKNHTKEFQALETTMLKKRRQKVGRF